MIYFAWGKPGAGKSFFVTWLALREMRKKKGKTVLSNYPITDHTTGQTSFIWNSAYVYEDVCNCLIILDEGYREASSRNFGAFTVDEHTFYGTNRHNDNDIWFMCHNPARIDVIIREMVDVFYYVSKLSILGRPLWFRISGFLDEADFALRYNSPELIYSFQRLTFKKSVRRAYDTHYFGRQSDNPPDYKLWSDSSDYFPYVSKPWIVTRFVRSIHQSCSYLVDKLKFVFHRPSGSADLVDKPIKKCDQKFNRDSELCINCNIKENCFNSSW